MNQSTALPDNMLFRKATLADAIKITRVYLISRKKLLAYAPLAHSDDDIFNWIQNTLIPTNQVTVVEKSGSIIGMMALSKNQGIGWIDQLYLLPTCVACGIGTQLINLAKDTLGSPIRLHTFQENIRAQQFYEKHAFSIIALSDGSTNEEHCPDMLYEWTTEVDKSPY